MFMAHKKFVKQLHNNKQIKTVHMTQIICTLKNYAYYLKKTLLPEIIHKLNTQSFIYGFMRQDMCSMILHHKYWTSQYFE